MKVKIVDLASLEEYEMQQMIHSAIAAYTGEKCRYCGHVYESVEDIRERKVVFAGPAMLACKACFDTANPANTGLQADKGTCGASYHRRLAASGMQICDHCHEPLAAKA